MKFKTDDGELLEGSSSLDILTNLKNGSRFDADRELDDYLVDLLERIREFYGVTYTHVDYDRTLNNLVEVGFLKKQ